MSLIDQTLKSNDHFVERIKSDQLLGRPAPKLVVVTCMDPRLTNILDALGLTEADADIIRNAGSTIDEDSIRSLLVSTRVLGSKEILIVNHTDCGMLTFKDEEMEAKLQKLTGISPIIPSRFYAFDNIEENVKEAIQKVRSHPWISKDIPVRGAIYDVKTGRLREVPA